MDNLSITTAISTMVLGSIALYFSWQQKKIAHDQMMKELFTEFNRRYDDVNQFLEEIERLYPTIDALNLAPNAVELKNRTIDYFNICAEEYFWHKKNRVDKEIWNSWFEGMNYWYNNVPSIKTLWEIEIREKGRKTYYIENGVGFFIDK